MSMLCLNGSEILAFFRIGDFEPDSEDLERDLERRVALLMNVGGCEAFAVALDKLVVDFLDLDFSVLFISELMVFNYLHSACESHSSFKICSRSC